MVIIKLGKNKFLRFVRRVREHRLFRPRFKPGARALVEPSPPDEKAVEEKSAPSSKKSQMNAKVGPMSNIATEVVQKQLLDSS